MDYIAHENWQNRGFTHFEAHYTLKIGRFARRRFATSGQTGSIANDFTGLFDLENGLIFSSGPTESIAKVLTDVHEIF
ncbi:hypothetical protein H5410_056492 [Solanum commersonii]|uniref:Uncharacterized protein n=1 Tax=Solanum commersonii TaxID=4109 RepID=A0A9J5WN87_SOLCO|nr:hypothetical protein H5410_056492 [Solanum commersonii]